MTSRPLSAAAQVQRLFDTKAGTWSAKYAPDGPLTGRLASLLAAVNAHAPSGGRVLDLGCGTGELARALAASGFDVTGCDISAEMLRLAADTPGRCAGWVRLEPSWRTLPFAPDSFDAVVAVSVLEYVPDPAAVLAECARVVRPGGAVLYTVPDLRHPARWVEWLVRRLVLITGAPLVLMTGAPPDRERRSRWHRYRAYLWTSVQHHRARWWLDASASVGLRPVQCRDSTGQPTLRLLAFRCVDLSGAQR